MKPESAKYIEQANVMLARADVMLTAGLAESAARETYLACFHVSQAYVFERTDRAPKTHNGVQTEFLRLTKDDSRADTALRRFLSQAYDFKAGADYFTGNYATLPLNEATHALATGTRFVEHFSSLVPVADVAKATDLSREETPEQQEKRFEEMMNTASRENATAQQQKPEIER